jgi:hypothetical protein
MRRNWTASLIIGLFVSCAVATAQDSRRSLADSGAPVVSLGRPQAIGMPSSQLPQTDDRIAPTSYQPSITSTSLQDPPPATGIATVQAAVPAAPFPPASPAEQYNCGVVTPGQPGFWQSIWEGPRKLFNCVPGVGQEQFEGPGARRWFQSDHCFDSFISPVTNPFLFEDPRSLTEVRPIYIFNKVSSRNEEFGGGNTQFFGLQARVAFTDWFSVVVNKFGATWIEPRDPLDPDFGSHSGFSEVWLGPKFTFLRNEDSGTLGAAGLTFEIPAGDRQVFQDTGSLSLVPYVSFGQNFFKTSYGSFNALATTGYSFSVNRERSENLFLSAHLDYDVANLHRIYPLLEMNWFHYTRNGKTEDINFEGRDLFNFGAEHVAGHDAVSLAAGIRVKLTEWWSAGFAAEFPLTTRRDLMDYRLTVDMIFRY